MIEPDREPDARGLHFVRCADDCVIAAGSSAAANRVMHTVTKWIEMNLKLKVNATKTKITKPCKLKYPGFGFRKDAKGWKAGPHKDSIDSFRRKLRKLTSRKLSVGMDCRIEKINQVTRGWINCYRIGLMKTAMQRAESGNHYRAAAGNT